MAEVKIIMNGQRSTDLCSMCHHSQIWHHLNRCRKWGCSCFEFKPDFRFVRLDHLYGEDWPTALPKDHG